MRKAQRWNIVWVVPILALFLGTWLLYRNFATRGPVANIHFDTAEEIYAGKTEIRCRSVKVGLVKDVKLSSDLNSVLVIAELESGTETLLREGSRFWVVKPRLSAAEISGLGTLIQGAYIELDPGPNDSNYQLHFEGLETPPATSSNVPGRRIILTTDEAGSLQIGAPVQYRGFEVGRIEGRRLSDDGSRVSYNAFISEEYSRLITDHTRFWNSSGLEINANAMGVVVRTPSLQSMVSGGVSFGLADGMAAGKPVKDGMSFTLFPDKDAAKRSTFNPSLKLLLLFNESVRGLTTSSPVEFRGIPIGKISQISFDLVDGSVDPRVPVLIEIDASLVRPESAQAITKSDSLFFQEEVDKGLRAGLKTSSLITGAVHIDFDYHADATPASLGKKGEYTTFPTISTSFAQLETKLNALLNKLQNVPISETMTTLNGAAEEGKMMAAAARKTLEDPAIKKLPAEIQSSLEELKRSVASLGPNGAVQGDLLRTLDELRATLRALKSVSETIDEKPNSLIFGRSSKDKNPTPKAPVSAPSSQP